MHAAVDTLLKAAVLAPSGDNTQPWKFEWCERDSALAILVDETRDQSPMNAGQRMARHACGAALENIVRTADHNQWSVAVGLHFDPVRVATIQLDAGDLPKDGAIDDAVRNRHTNRRLYDREQACPPPEVRLSPEETAHVEIQWITDRAEIDQWADTIGKLDTLMFQQPGVLRAFLANVRFDRPAEEAVDHGLSVGSLAVSTVQAATLPYLRYLPDAVIASRMMTAPLGQHSKQLVRSAAGLCVMRTKQSGAINDVVVGRLMQRVWLALTEANFAVQPMMSLPVLRSMTDADALQPKARAKFCSVAAEPARNGDSTLEAAAALRFGVSTNPICRTDRLPAACGDS